MPRHTGAGGVVHLQGDRIGGHAVFGLRAPHVDGGDCAHKDVLVVVGELHSHALVDEGDVPVVHGDVHQHGGVVGDHHAVSPLFTSCPT